MDLLKKIVSKATSDKRTLAITDPFRFQGAGVDFRCKLIGVRDLLHFSSGDGVPPEVLCFEQMLLVKDSAAHSGYHKRKVILNVSIAGLKIKDAKCGAELFHIPAASIPFLQLDRRDPRAFSFIISTQGGHKFFGIKTAGAAEGAVRTINEMFQVVFEMDGGRIDNGVPVADLLDFAASPSPFTRPVNTAMMPPLQLDLYIRSPPPPSSAAIIVDDVCHQPAIADGEFELPRARRAVSTTESAFKLDPFVEDFFKRQDGKLAMDGG